MESKIHGDRGPGKNKRKWNEIEDEKLVEAMVEIRNSGSHFKSDNGFKPGLFGAVEIRLAVSLPNSRIKAKPHIESRIKTLKSDWSIVHDMMSWNHGTTKMVLDGIMKIRCLKLLILFGKHMLKYRRMQQSREATSFLITGTYDRANGRDAQTATYVISEINNEQREPDDCMKGIGDELKDIDVDAPMNSPAYAHSKVDLSTIRKRKRRNSWDPLMTSLKDSTYIIGSKIDNATSSFNAVLESREIENTYTKKVVGLIDCDCNKDVRML
uniref:Myb/SANT-like domain-containing protein n=1 Tax=Lactuca sativa TaxID=4236 RepID=A0A9R1UUE5_LACSA|nr:hypothetical protein LSAT_V11C800422470 [Lactuca sativa]